MTDLLNFFVGKKTYIVVFIGASIGMLQAIWPEVVIPDYVYLILSAAGLGAVRAAIPKSPPQP